MKIAVLMKTVLDCGVSLAVDEKNLAVSQKDQAPCWVTNPADRAALEAALSLTVGGRPAQVTALSVGHRERTEALYYALARGAHRGIFIEAPVGMTHQAAFVASAAAACLRRERIDLVLCGDRSLDLGMGLVGPHLAEGLGLPHVSGAVKIEVRSAPGMVTVQRRLERGNREVLECVLPAVVSVDPLIASPRYVSVHALQEAKKCPLETIPVDALGSFGDDGVRTQLLKIEPPRPRPKRTFVPDAGLTPAERMKLIRSGGIAARQKESEVLSGTAEQVAEGIFTFLRNKGLLP